MLWFVFGYKPDFKGVNLQVANWSPFSGFEFEIKIPRDGGKVLKIVYRKKEKKSGNREFFINGEGPFFGTKDARIRTHCYFLPYADMAAQTTVEIID